MLKKLALAVFALLLIGAIPAFAQDAEPEPAIAYASQGDTWVRSYPDRLEIERNGITTIIPNLQVTITSGPLENGIVVNEEASAALIAFGDAVYMLELLDNNGWMISNVDETIDTVYASVQSGQFALCVVAIRVEEAIPSLHALNFLTDGTEPGDCREVVDWADLPGAEIGNRMTTIMATTGDN